MTRYVVFAIIVAMVVVSAVAEPLPALATATTGPPPAPPAPPAGSNARASSESEAGSAAVTSAAAVDSSGAESDDETAESQAAFPKKQPGHEPWETVLALPGYAIYLPFWAVFTATGASIKLAEKTGAVDRLKDVVTFGGADGRGGIYPAYSGRTGAGLAFFLKDYINKGFRFDVTAEYGFLDRSLLRVRYRRLELFHGAMITGLNAQYRNMPSEWFFGIGPDAPKKPKTNYRRSVALGEVTLGRRVGPDLDVNLVGGVEYNTIDDGRKPGIASTLDEFPGLPGAHKELTLGSFGVRGVYDGRNSDFRPSSGFLAIADASVDQDIGGNDFGYTSVLAEYRQFIPLFHNRVLMLRANGWFTDPLHDRAIPFYKLPAHGDDATVRGYSRDRWRDQDAVLASVEYRWPIWRTIDALLFTDASQVAPSIFDDFDTSKIKYSWGGGFRLYTRSNTDTWFFIAKSKDGLTVHFRLN